jgi:hypothetical protein
MDHIAIVGALRLWDEWGGGGIGVSRQRYGRGARLGYRACGWAWRERWAWWASHSWGGGGHWGVTPVGWERVAVTVTNGASHPWEGR